MKNLPALDRWEPTAHGLHAAAQLLGAIRQLVREPVANYLELALPVRGGALSSDTLPGGGRVLLDFGRAALVYTSPAGQQQILALAGHSQLTLFEALLRALAAGGEGLAPPRAGQSHIQAMLAALEAKGHVFKPKSGELTGDAPLEVDPALSAEYGEVLRRVFTAVARFRAGLDGIQTPIVVWPEHFDLSTLWFPGLDRSDSAAQMNFGFAPFDGVHPRPYLYAYAYPMPAGFEALPLPAPAHWNSAPWQGLVLHYDDLRTSEDPEGLIEATCAAVYGLLAPTLRQGS